MSGNNNGSSTKGNPASHRMGNKNLKARREQSWRRGQERKEKRRRASEALHRERMEHGGLGRRERRRIESGKRLAR